jgi:hypothetical protein
MSKKQIESKAMENSKFAQLLLQTPAQTAVLSADMLSEKGENIAKELRAEQQAIIDRVRGGDMADMEALLVGQALTLQAMFTKYGMLINQNTNNVKNMQAVFNMAMKAQSQSRATIEALTALKYPKQVVITKQANITNGNQQVNNRVDVNFATNTRTHAQARENTINQNELLEVDNGTQAMDGRATLRTGTENKELATVATQHRRKNSRG